MFQKYFSESDKKLKLESDHLKESDTVAQTLWYTCLNHYTNASREYSVDYIKRALDISQNEFEWIALTVSKAGCVLEIEKTNNTVA